MYSWVVFSVKVFPAAMVTAMMLMALSSGVAMADSQSPPVEAQPFPSITLNMSSGIYYNLSYMGLILETSNGSFISNFNHGKWNFTTGPNGTYSYASDIKFLPDNSHGMFNASIDSQVMSHSHGGNGKGHNSSNGNPPTNSTRGSNGKGPANRTSHFTLYANVVIDMKALNYSLSNMSVGNSSAESGNYSFPQFSMLEITLSITFENPVNGSGNLQLIQMIKSSNTSDSANGYYFGNIAHGHSKKAQENSQGVQIPAGNNKSMNGSENAFYWWNNNFMLNGVSQNLSSKVDAADGGVFITFNFAFNNSTALKSVYQDPYFGIPGTPIFKNPIVKKVVGTIVNYVLVNIKSLSVGLAFGLVMIGGASYSVYRKRRF